MNPDRSFERITRLPNTRSTKSPARIAVSSLVSSEVTSSTRRIRGTGWKKCSPRPPSGGRVARASRMMGMDDVLEERIVPAEVTRSISANTADLTSKRSTTASITSSRSASAAIWVVNSIRSRASARASGASLPRPTALFSDASMRRRPADNASSVTSVTMTSSPARAHTSAMPEPISPHPTTPTRSMPGILTSEKRSSCVLTSAGPLVSPSLTLLAMDVLSRCVGQGRVSRAAHGRGLAPLAGSLRNPGGPVLPPGPFLQGGARQPFLRVGRELLVGPVLPLGVRRVDDAGDVPRGGQDEAHVACQKLRRRVGAAPGCDVVLDRPHDVDVPGDVPKLEVPARQRHLVPGELVLVVAVAEVERVHGGGHAGAVGVPGQDVEGGRVLAHEPVGRNVVPDQVVGTQGVEGVLHVARVEEAGLRHLLLQLADGRRVRERAEGTGL